MQSYYSSFFGEIRKLASNKTFSAYVSHTVSTSVSKTMSRLNRLLLYDDEFNWVALKASFSLKTNSAQKMKFSVTEP